MEHHKSPDKWIFCLYQNKRNPDSFTTMLTCLGVSNEVRLMDHNTNVGVGTWPKFQGVAMGCLELPRKMIPS